ncbi:MAG: hypothetical protein ACRC0L_02770, partial [Angustibacter sp.]
MLSTTFPAESGSASTDAEQLTLSDAAIADLHLVLLGLTLPWAVLGGTSADPPPASGRVEIRLSPTPQWANEPLPSGVLLLDRESTPL